MTTPIVTTPREEADLRRFRRLADLFDSAFRVPGTRWRFGLDALLGLVPVAGDVAGAAFALYGVWTARRIGAPAVVLAHMLVNVALDLLVGLVPVAGDVSDFFFQSHARNRRLLEAWLADPPRATRRSRGVVVGVPLGALVLLLAAVTAAVWAFVLFARWLAGVWT